YGKFTVFTQKDGRAYRARVIFQDHEGSIWFGTEEGLALLRNGEFKNFDNPTLLAGGATCIYQDADNVMWFGTFGSGLVRYQNGQFTTYRTKDGLSDDTIWSLLEDHRGNFWMSSDHGLSRTHKADLNDFAAHKIQAFQSTSFGLADDLPTTDFNGGAQATGWKTSDGHLIFATSKGMVEVDPEKLVPNPVPPPVVIEAIQVNGSRLEGVKAPVGRGELDFHFAALSFVLPEMLDFKYKLEPFDQEWNHVKSKRDAHYTNMAPGEYSFHVIAANNDGTWNNIGATYKFYLEPRFYQTGWFYTL